jgi:hypothetical protein
VRQPFREMVIELADGYLSPREVLCAHWVISPVENTALSRFHIDVYLVHLRSEYIGCSPACNGSTNKVFYLAEFRTLVGNRKHQSFASGTFST